MGQQIIKQPDGRFAVFSTNTDTIMVWDGTAQEIVEWFAERAAFDARQTARLLLSLVDAGDTRSAYHQFAMSWDEALEMDRDHGGDAHRHFVHSGIQEDT
jgi:hypothetical protein